MNTVFQHIIRNQRNNQAKASLQAQEEELAVVDWTDPETIYAA